MYDYRTAAAYMAQHLPGRSRRPADVPPARSVYHLPLPRRTPRTDGDR